MSKDYFKVMSTQDNSLKCLALSTTKSYSIYFYRGLKKLVNIHITEAEVRTF